MNNIILSKSSAPEQVKNYFQKVFELKQTGKDFPVNLDDVWPLVYPRKDHAVRLLKESFIQGIHYQCFPKNGESKIFEPQNFTKAGGDRKSLDYYLSVPCVEFFIASKKPEVFEVYRQVFHNAVENMQANIMFDKKWITRQAYCQKFNTTAHSFFGLMGHYSSEFMFINSTWHMSAELAKTMELRQLVDTRRKVYRQRTEENRQLQLNFKENTLN